MDQSQNNQQKTQFNDLFQAQNVQKQQELDENQQLKQQFNTKREEQRNYIRNQSYKKLLNKKRATVYLNTGTFQNSVHVEISQSILEDKDSLNKFKDQILHECSTIYDQCKDEFSQNYEYKSQKQIQLDEMLSKVVVLVKYLEYFENFPIQQLIDKILELPYVFYLKVGEFFTYIFQQDNILQYIETDPIFRYFYKLLETKLQIEMNQKNSQNLAIQKYTELNQNWPIVIMGNYIIKANQYCQQNNLNKDYLQQLASQMVQEIWKYSFRSLHKNFDQSKDIIWVFNLLSQNSICNPQIFNKLLDIVLFLEQNLEQPDNLDDEIIWNMLSIIRNMYMIKNQQQNIWKDKKLLLIVQFMAHPKNMIADCSLEIIEMITQQQTMKISIILSQNILNYLMITLTKNSSTSVMISLKIVENISNIVGSDKNSQDKSIDLLTSNYQLLTILKNILSTETIYNRKIVYKIIQNIAKAGNKDQVGVIIQLGFIEQIALGLQSVESQQIYLNLMTIQNLLRRGQNEFGKTTLDNPIKQILDRTDFRVKIEELQYHKCDVIYEKSYEIIEEFYNYDNVNDENQQYIGDSNDSIDDNSSSSDENNENKVLEEQFYREDEITDEQFQSNIQQIQ